MKNFENQRKIIKLSKFFWVLCRVILWMMVLVPLLIVGTVWLMDLARAGTVSVSATADELWWKSGAIMVVSQVPSYVIFFVMILKLHRFFARLSQGILFDAESAACLRIVGLLWLINWLYSWVPALIKTIIAFQHLNVMDFVAMIVRGNVSPFYGLILGLAILLVAWLLREATDLQDDRQLTV